MAFAGVNANGETTYLGITGGDWIKILLALLALYVFLAVFFLVLFVITQAIVFPSNDANSMSRPCPFDGIEKLNCHGLCAGPPQLIQPWQYAPEGSDEKAEASDLIKAWIEGSGVFAGGKGIKWQTEFQYKKEGGKEALGSHEWMLTTDFYQRVGCCGAYEDKEDVEDGEETCGKFFIKEPKDEDIEARMAVVAELKKDEM
eukprot:TRINITY_DN823_c0_g2_i1.p1 TRINITY_DN823_c0_g2~~TRINITY_DN823_c0_g2_i1.p1  ORF type:complete len:201 (+),score=64.79 TRINITY_DN823_c0_g2_i1:106-708(+)